MRRNYNTNSPVRSYGFKRLANTSHITGWIRSIIRNCNMWKGYQAVIISMDIKTFFDALSHTVMYNAMKKAGIPRHNINAIMKRLPQEENQTQSK